MKEEDNLNNELKLSKVWPQSQLMTGISCLTYGVSCYYFDRESQKLLRCVLSIHEEYINILHVIVQAKFSILFELQNIESISDKDIYIKNTLRRLLNSDSFIILYTGNLDSHVLVMGSDNEKDVIWEGLQFFIHEANHFYDRISRMDPFKAELTMLFLEADSDGSSLLDIEELLSIFNKLKINCEREEIQKSIQDINLNLYDKENLSKPKGFTNSMLTPLGFEYILRFYSMRASIAPLFTEFCPIFKLKHKKFKKSITDILKSQNKPLMSPIQLKEFLAKYIPIPGEQAISEEQCAEIIRAFPIYDGEGKEIPEEAEYLTFNTFCNLVFSLSNSLVQPKFMEVHQQMGLPLTEYYVYSSSNTYLSGTTVTSDSKLEMYENSLKKGCRCLELDIQNLGQELVVKHKNSKNSIDLADVLTTIKNIGFGINPFPIILSIEFNFPLSLAAKAAKIFQQELAGFLNVFSPHGQYLPSPLELAKKIILHAVDPIKDTQSPFAKLFSLIPTKFDFQRKGYTSSSSCQLKRKDILRFEELEEKNLVDYCRKVMVRTLPTESKSELENYDTMPMLRSGIQLISFNLQQEDEHHYFMHSKFLENGGKKCGYFLKPTWLRSNCHESMYPSNFDTVAYIVKVKVYAGQKITLSNTTSKHFVLEVYVRGVALDEKNNKKYTSQPTSEGFYTDFELQCEFAIRCVDMAHLVFSVVDGAGNIMSYRAVGLVHVREGLRTVQLLGPGMELYMNSCLVVECWIREDDKKKKKGGAFQI